MAQGALTPVQQETLAVFGGSGEPLTTPEVAETLAVDRRTAYARLERLVDDGFLRTKKVGASARVWWRPRESDRADDTTADHEGATGSDDGGTAGQTTDEEWSFSVKRAMDEAPAGITVTDPTRPDNPIIYANDKFEEVTGYSPADARGQNCRFLQGAETAVEPVAEIRAAVDNQEDVEVELRNYRKDGTAFWNQVSITPVRDDDGSVVNYVGFQQDITERKRLERDRRRQLRQQEAVADLGKEALEDHDLDTLLADAGALVAETLDNDYCKILEFDRPTETLHLRQGVGWADGVVGEATVSAVEADSQAAYTLSAEAPVVVENLAADSRFDGPTLLTSHDVTSGISTVIGSPDDPWGILGTHDTDQQTFHEQDVTFVQSVANILATAIDRQQDRAELRRQRTELATLVNLNTVVHETTESVIAKSTRAEIEQAVCDRLSASESYESAWLAGIDSQANKLDVHASAGGDQPEPPIGAANLESHEQLWRAIREQHLRLVPEPSTLGLSAGENRAENRSVAIIPIVHEGTVYGALGVAADRPTAFGSAERTVISRLGEVVGHAIAAVERKRALVSEEVVELTFRVPDVFGDLPTPGDGSGTITFDEVIPIQDEEFLVHGTATDDAKGVLTTMIEEVPGWESVSFTEGGSEYTFEVKLSDQPVLAKLLSLGGSHEESVIEDGDYRLTVQLDPSADVRRLTETVRESFPAVELVTRHQTTRGTGYRETPRNSITKSLTDRQQTVLRAAYHAGLFEWPRDSTAEEVADSLEIAPSTFHQHLRKAERKVVSSVLSADQLSPPD